MESKTAIFRAFIIRFKRFLKKEYKRLIMHLNFIQHYYYFRSIEPHRFLLNWRDRWPCYKDATPSTEFDKHYVYHIAWACRVLSEIRPIKHVDISSSLYFCSSASAFIPIEFYDFRPADLRLDGLTCNSCDILNLPFPDNQLYSISCLHVLEHIGLGRYGDKLDYDGDLKAALELIRVTAKGGYILVAVPIGSKSIIQFNAHRIYKHIDFINLFSGLTLLEFSLIPDKTGGGLIRHADIELADKQDYGCGCYLFRKV